VRVEQTHRVRSPFISFVRTLSDDASAHVRSFSLSMPSCQGLKYGLNSLILCSSDYVRQVRRKLGVGDPLILLAFVL